MILCEHRLLPMGSTVVPFGGSSIDSCKVLPKRNYYGAYGYLHGCKETGLWSTML